MVVAAIAVPPIDDYVAPFGIAGVPQTIPERLRILALRGDVRCDDPNAGQAGRLLARIPSAAETDIRSIASEERRPRARRSSNHLLRMGCALTGPVRARSLLQAPPLGGALRDLIIACA